MTSKRIIQLLTAERACVIRNAKGKCKRNCSDCYLVQKDDELIEMYTLIIEFINKLRRLALKEKYNG